MALRCIAELWRKQSTLFVFLFLFLDNMSGCFILSSYDLDSLSVQPVTVCFLCKEDDKLLALSRCIFTANVLCFLILCIINEWALTPDKTMDYQLSCWQHNETKCSLDLSIPTLINDERCKNLKANPSTWWCLCF